MKPKIGYKGTDKDMKCMGNTQFELGKTYFINNDNKVEVLPESYNIIALKGNVELHSKNAIHYCNELKNVPTYYPNNGTNRYFKIEVIGDFVDIGNKSGARCIRFIEEVGAKEFAEIERAEKERILHAKMKLENVKLLQTLNPNLIVGGSIGLYLHGVRLKRFSDTKTVIDYDLVLPFYQILKNGNQLRIYEDVVEKGNGYGTDFEITLTIDGVKADLRIDPKQRYEIIEHKGYKYKVVPLISIIRAKANYAHTMWGGKHRDDLIEMILDK